MMSSVRTPCAGTFLALLLFFPGCGEAPPSPFLEGAHGDYLVQPPASRQMEIFAPGLVTFGTHEHHLTFTPDGTEIFWVIADRGRQHHTIIHMVRDGDDWYRPQVAAFSGRFNDFAPTPTPDGRFLLFCSNRPLPGEGEAPADVNIWRVERVDGGWGEPYPLPGEVNDESGDYNPTVAMDGTLYFQDFDGTSVDIFRSVPVEGVYGVPEEVEVVNTDGTEMAPLVTPDGRRLVFSSDRPGGEGELDFWASALDGSGTWSEPVNLGPGINTPSFDAIITASPDGSYLFFTNFMSVSPERLQGRSYEELVRILGGPENGDGTIYWISAAVLEEALAGR